MLLAASTMLPGCGAVGGDSTWASAPSALAATAPRTPVAALTPADANLLVAVAPSTHRLTTPEKGAWDYLQTQRHSCGFGLLRQDARADTAASAHATYLVRTSLAQGIGASGHTEDARSPYFYGASPAARLQRAGFPAHLGNYEILNTFQSLQSPASPAVPLLGEELGRALVRNLIESVYHARGAFVAGGQGGVGASRGTVRHGVDGAPDGLDFTHSTLVLDFSNDATQKLGKGQIATYPCAGSSTVGGSFAPSTESPNPYPDAPRRAIYGTPIYFKADAGSTLTIRSATLVEAATGASLPFRQMTQTNDPHGQLGAHEVFLTPTAALAPGSRYTVSATGTLDGAAFSKIFSFSTAP